jgi:hypothetical protein
MQNEDSVLYSKDQPAGNDFGSFRSMQYTPPPYKPYVEWEGCSRGTNSGKIEKMKAGGSGLAPMIQVYDSQ